MTNYLLILLIFYASKSFALECEWWQTQVRAHKVQEHHRKESTISTHARKEHCREKWKGSDIYTKHISDSISEAWQNTKESYKFWKRSEKESILETLAKVPDVYKMENFYFYRSSLSETKSNSASIHIYSRSITLYDPFFSSNNKESILVHESGHYHFFRLSETNRDQFLNLSGWKRYIQNGSLTLNPPTNLIKEDSFISPDEDFANHLEVYFDEPAKLKSTNIKLFQFFDERYKP